MRRASALPRRARGLLPTEKRSKGRKGEGGGGDKQLGFGFGFGLVLQIKISLGLGLRLRARDNDDEKKAVRCVTFSPSSLEEEAPIVYSLHQKKKGC
jgi:hypothetical protein